MFCIFEAQDDDDITKYPQTILYSIQQGSNIFTYIFVFHSTFVDEYICMLKY